MRFDTHPESSTYEHQPEPDAWWGAEGIDVPVWADGTPYAEQADAYEPPPIVPEVSP